jgi:hypothetical protein
LRRIRRHLYQEGYTIRGVQKLLSEGEPDGEASPRVARARAKVIAGDTAEIAAHPDVNPTELQRVLREVRTQLLEIRTLLDKLLAR